MPKDCGNGIWLFQRSVKTEEYPTYRYIYPIELFAEDLGKFKSEHPNLKITAIVPVLFGGKGWGANVDPDKYLVNTER